MSLSSLTKTSCAFILAWACVAASWASEYTKDQRYYFELICSGIEYLEGFEPGERSHKMMQRRSKVDASLGTLRKSISEFDTVTYEYHGQSFSQWIHRYEQWKNERKAAQDRQIKNQRLRNKRSIVNEIKKRLAGNAADVEHALESLKVSESKRLQDKTIIDGKPFGAWYLEYIVTPIREQNQKLDSLYAQLNRGIDTSISDAKLIQISTSLKTASRMQTSLLSGIKKHYPTLEHGIFREAQEKLSKAKELVDRSERIVARRALERSYQANLAQLRKQMSVSDKQLSQLQNSIDERSKLASNTQLLEVLRKGFVGTDKEFEKLKRQFPTLVDRDAQSIANEISLARKKAATLDKKLKALEEQIREEKQAKKPLKQPKLALPETPSATKPIAKPAQQPQPLPQKNQAKTKKADPTLPEPQAKTHKPSETPKPVSQPTVDQPPFQPDVPPPVISPPVQVDAPSAQKAAPVPSNLAKPSDSEIDPQWTQLWLIYEDGATRAAKKLNRKVIVFFSNTEGWSPWNQNWIADVFNQESFKAYAESNLIRWVVELGEDQSASLLESNTKIADKYGIYTVPSVLLLSPDMKEIKRWVGGPKDSLTTFLETLGN